MVTLHKAELNLSIRSKQISKLPEHLQAAETPIVNSALQAIKQLASQAPEKSLRLSQKIGFLFHTRDRILLLCHGNWLQVLGDSVRVPEDCSGESVVLSAIGRIASKATKNFLNQYTVRNRVSLASTVVIQMDLETTLFSVPLPEEDDPDQTVAAMNTFLPSPKWEFMWVAFDMFRLGQALLDKIPNSSDRENLAWRIPGSSPEVYLRLPIHQAITKALPELAPEKFS